jgi:hypothetical protein
LKLVEISCLVSTAPRYAIEAVKIPLSGSVAGFASDIARSTFTTSSSKPLPFRFDGCATSISLTEAAALVSGSGCNTNP